MYIYYINKTRLFLIFLFSLSVWHISEIFGSNKGTTPLPLVNTNSDGRYYTMAVLGSFLVSRSNLCMRFPNFVEVVCSGGIFLPGESRHETCLAGWS